MVFSYFRPLAPNILRPSPLSLKKQPSPGETDLPIYVFPRRLQKTKKTSVPRMYAARCENDHHLERFALHGGCDNARREGKSADSTTVTKTSKGGPHGCWT